jgi:hypothetical protein
MATPPRGAPPQAALSALIAEAVHIRTVEALLSLAANPEAAAPVRALVFAKLLALRRSAEAGSAADLYLAQRIDLLARDPDKFVRSPPVAAPPGMPIGDREE